MTWKEENHVCQRPGCTNRIPRHRIEARAKTCCGECARQVHQAQNMSGVCGDCGGRCHVQAKRCRNCHAQYIENFGQMLPEETGLTMRQKARQKYARLRGHEITPMDLEVMRAMSAAGKTTREIGQKFGLSSASVSVYVRFGGWYGYRASLRGAS